MNYKISKKELEKRLNLIPNLFRESGKKVTPQRLEIYRVLLESSTHPTIYKIFEEVQVQFPNISLDTVYRNLESLEEMNLINRISGLEGKYHFEANIEPHHHFICRECFIIYDFNLDKPTIEKNLISKELEEVGKIETTQLIVKGICKKCSVSK